MNKRTPEYQAWLGMRSRCNNPKEKSWPDYGGRGIKVCDEWMNDFSAFYSHIGPKPTKSHTIDRINNDGDYEPGNVRWATRTEQNLNRRKYKHTKLKTHCPSGHEYTPDNTWVQPSSGARRCRECLNERARLFRLSHPDDISSISRSKRVNHEPV